MTVLTVFLWPNGLTTQPAVTSPYGWRWHPILKTNRLHQGADFIGFDKVHSIAAGKIHSVGFTRERGWNVVIDHGNGLYSGYLHLREGSIPSALMRRGTAVSAGTVVGRMGMTGLATGVHLHLNVQDTNISKNGGYVDPVPFLRERVGKKKPTSKATRKVRGTVNANGRSAPKMSGQVKQLLKANTVGTFNGYRKGEKVTQGGVTSDIWFRGAFNGNWFWAGSFTNQTTAGLDRV